MSSRGKQQSKLPQPAGQEGSAWVVIHRWLETLNKTPFAFHLLKDASLTAHLPVTPIPPGSAEASWAVLTEAEERQWTPVTMVVATAAYSLSF